MGPLLSPAPSLTAGGGGQGRGGAVRGGVETIVGGGGERGVAGPGQWQATRPQNPAACQAVRERRGRWQGTEDKYNRAWTPLPLPRLQSLHAPTPHNHGCAGAPAPLAPSPRQRCSTRLGRHTSQGNLALRRGAPGPCQAASLPFGFRLPRGAARARGRARTYARRPPGAGPRHGPPSARARPGGSPRMRKPPAPACTARTRCLRPPSTSTRTWK